MSRIESLSAFLEAHILGQTQAVHDFAATLAIALEGRPRPERTKGFVFLAGPTGTGKTELVKLAARHLYGAGVENHFRRFDMAEYQHADSIQRLLGAPDQPALLGRAIDELNQAAGPAGTGFLLLDEIEKAYSDLITVLLAFDAARVTTHDGCTRDLSKLFVFVTSNVGAAHAADLVHLPYQALRDEVLLQAEKKFRKETVARFDARIVMNRLDYQHQREITQRLLEQELLAQRAHLQRPLRYAPDVLNFLIRIGYTPDLGVRHLRSTVERQVGWALLPWNAEHEGQDSPDLFSRMLELRPNKSGTQLTAVKIADLQRSASLRTLLAQSTPPLQPQEAVA